MSFSGIQSHVEQVAKKMGKEETEEILRSSVQDLRFKRRLQSRVRRFRPEQAVQVKERAS